MNFGFGEEEQRLRSEIRTFVSENLPKGHIGNMFEEEHDEVSWQFSMSISRKLAEKGWLTLAWPTEFGGKGESCWERFVFAEEAGYWGIPGTSMGISGTAWVGPSLMLYGTRQQQDTYIPPIAAGEPDGIWCTGYSEPDAGTDLAGIQTFAERDGDSYIINGQKVWTSCAQWARWLWLACRTSHEVSKKHQGLSMFIVDMKSKGLTVRPIRNFTGGHVFNEVFLNNVRVPVTNLVGRENNGWHQLMTALSFERGTALTHYGALQRMLDELIEYTKQQGLFSRQHIRHRLSKLFVDIQAFQTLAWEEAGKVIRGESAIYEPSRNKACQDDLYRQLSRCGMDILGAYSQTGILNDRSRWTRLKGAFGYLYYYCIGMAIAAGTTDTQKNIVGQFGLGLQKAY